MERNTRTSLDEGEVQLGDVRIQYCVARHHSGNWFVVGSVLEGGRSHAHTRRLVSGSGSTESEAVERMVERVAAVTVDYGEDTADVAAAI